MHRPARSRPRVQEPLQPLLLPALACELPSSSPLVRGRCSPPGVSTTRGRTAATWCLHTQQLPRRICRYILHFTLHSPAPSWRSSHRPGLSPKTTPIPRPVKQTHVEKFCVWPGCGRPPCLEDVLQPRRERPFLGAGVNPIYVPGPDLVSGRCGFGWIRGFSVMGIF